MRITARANAWKKVGGVLGDRRISRKRKGNVLVCYHGIHECIRDDGINRETIGDIPGEKQPDKNNRGS